MPQESTATTGVAGLDALLQGPIDPGSLVFIVGPPGAGKTVLASQLVFAAAARGVPGVIFTSYSENQTKLIQHLRGFAFFEERMVGAQVTLRAVPELKGNDPAGATGVLIHAIRETGAKLALIDGFQSIEPMLSDPHALRRMLAGLSTQLSYIDATLLITLTGNAREPTSSGFLTVSDTLLGLGYELVGPRHVRSVEVVKQRGRAQLPGAHAYQIDHQGVTVLPRIEVYPRPASATASSDRMPFGLPELDALLSGGPNLGTTTVLAGAPGAGKTILALHWALHQARADAPTIFLTFREDEAQLALKAAAFDLDLSASVASGAVRVLRVDPVELDVDQLGVALIAALATRPARLVVDDLAPLLRELGPRAHDYIAGLIAHLRGAQVTTMALLEIAPFVGFRLDLVGSPVGLIGENVLILQQHERSGVLHRVLAVLRMRLSDYDQTMREVQIGAAGVRVLRLDETQPGVLASAAHGQGGLAGAHPPAQDA